jgi:hypothetical protein
MKKHGPVKPLRFLFEKTGASDPACCHNIIKRGVVFLKNGGEKIKHCVVGFVIILGMILLRIHYREYVNSMQETLETLVVAIQHGELPWDEAIVSFCQGVVFSDE